MRTDERLWYLVQYMIGYDRLELDTTESKARNEETILEPNYTPYVVFFPVKLTFYLSCVINNDIITNKKNGM